MSVPPRQHRVQLDDFGALQPALRMVLERVLRPLNTFVAEVATALRGRLTFEDNHLAQRIAYELKTDAADRLTSFGFHLHLKDGMPAYPIAVWLLSAKNKTDPTTTYYEPVWCHWEATGDGRVKIKFISGVTEGQTYDLDFLVIGR